MARKDSLEESPIATVSDLDGSVTGLGHLLDHYREFLLRVANEHLHSNIAPKYAASDIVQDTLLQAVSAFPQFRGTTHGELRSWLRKILVNKLCDATRFFSAQRRDCSLEVSPAGEASSGIPIEPQSPQPTPSEAYVASEDELALHAALSRLSAAEQDIIEMRNMLGLSFEEMGSQLSKTAEAARKQWARAVDHLTRELARGRGNG